MTFEIVAFNILLYDSYLKAIVVVCWISCTV